MRIGIIKEGKIPPDTRVPLSPEQCAYVMNKYPVEIWVQPSPNRCFTDEEYAEQGVRLTEEMEKCDVLMGVKEVKIKDLINDKKYFFFSHTIKRQPYNQDLLRAVVEKNIQLLDYEVSISFIVFSPELLKWILYILYFSDSGTKNEQYSL